ncbi:MAG: zinc ribbon domain-containing protein [Clostridia bacterium]
MDFMKKITEISRKVGDAATDTYNTVADKSGKFIEDTKFKMSISDKETKVNEIYEVIGKTVYDSYKQGEDVGHVFTKEAKKVDKLFNEIDEMKTKVLYNKGLKICCNCGEMISFEAQFCSNCGEKQKKVKIKEDKKDEATEPEVTASKVCAKCGLVAQNNDKFCIKCGYSFEK